MEYNRTSKRAKLNNLTGGRDISLFPTALQFYPRAPTADITLKEFEEWAVERLQVLRIVENFGLKFQKMSKEYTTGLRDELKKKGFYGYIRMGIPESNMTDLYYDERKKDYNSHFILRLAFCKSEELRRWFITQELDFFRFKYGMESLDQIKRFFQLNNINYTPIDADEKSNIAKQLASSNFQLTVSLVEGKDFFKVPFVEVLDLVRTRKTFLKKGFAYVETPDLVSVIITRYRVYLSKVLSVMSQDFHKLQYEDLRLHKIANGLSKCYVGTDYNKSENPGSLTPESIEQAAKTSFPLCMKTLHESLRKDHHLKHWGRQQYGLFLKGAGMTLEDALRFWKTEFTKSMDGTKFDKSYSYNIRHNFGKEGKRTNYTPYNCSKILTTNAPSVGDCHGCPYRHYSVDALEKKLKSLEISSKGITEIKELVSKKHFQHACSKHFELTHKGSSINEPIDHPNQFYDLSKQFYEGQTIKKGSNVKVTRVSVYQKPKEETDFESEFMDDTEMQDILKATQEY